MHILIADKDHSVTSVVSTRLTSRNYTVTEVKTSEGVLRELRREKYDLALISTSMERVGGKLLIEKIRSHTHLMALPIIMMTTEHEITELILSQERGFDDFLIKPFSPLALQLRVALNISRMRMRSDANALTHLPGNVAIENLILSKISKGDKFSVLYVDINQFKSFNDRYGFEKGDNVLRQTARILIQTKESVCGERECFVGHIGGDDFIVVLSPDDEENFARQFISEFDRIILTYYTKEDQAQGGIEVANRRGKKETFPLMSCSVAACTNIYRPYHSLGEIAQDAAQVKAFLKSQTGSHYLRDRRSMPMQHLEQAVHVLSSDTPLGKKAVSVDPLGKILLNAGLVNEEQLSRAIKRHMLTGQRLGQTLIAMNLVRSEDVGRMLEKKLNVPYISLKKTVPDRDVLRLFTSDFMQSHRVLPLRVSAGNLNLAMCDPFDLKTLDAIERISGLKPVPHLALEDEFEDFMEKLRKERSQEQLTGS